MRLEWYHWVAIVILLVRTPFCFVTVQREADDIGSSWTVLTIRSLELLVTVAALVAVLAHGTGSW